MHVDNWIHDLRDPRSYIWDQGDRPTCLAIAASTAHQLARTHPEPFAPDALWLHALNAGDASDDGTTTAAIGEALRDCGQPVATVWPYELPLSSVVPPNSAGTPPWLRAELSAETPTADGIRDVLASGVVPVVTLRIYDSFYLGPGDRVLDVLGPSEAFYGYHAVCIVGYVEHAGEEWFVIQNSWGADWGARGLAMLSQRYLAATLAEVVVVSPVST